MASRVEIIWSVKHSSGVGARRTLECVPYPSEHPHVAARIAPSEARVDLDVDAKAIRDDGHVRGALRRAVHPAPRRPAADRDDVHAGGRQRDLRRRRRDVRGGQVQPVARAAPRRQVRADARRRRAPPSSAAPHAALPGRAHAALRAGHARCDRSRDRRLVTGQRVRSTSAHAGHHAARDPQHDLRLRRRASLRRDDEAHEADPRARGVAAAAPAVHAGRPRPAKPVGEVQAREGPRGRVSLRADRRATQHAERAAPTCSRCCSTLATRKATR